MYWCAGSTPDGSGQLMQEKWKILCFHIQNIHANNNSQLHPECGHGELKGDANFQRRRNYSMLTCFISSVGKQQKKKSLVSLWQGVKINISQQCLLIIDNNHGFKSLYHTKNDPS